MKQIDSLTVFNAGEKIRIGNESDGGYVLPKIALEKTGQLFSYGISNDISFDEHYIEMTKFQKKAFGFDHTIEGIKTLYGDHFTHFREGLSALETPQTNNFLIHFEKHGNQSEVLLKIDVEGAEYEYFENTDCFFLSKVAKCIVIEFHWLSDSAYRNRFFNIVKELNKYYRICHVHGNNYDTVFTYREGNFSCTMPNVIELTFLAKDICQNEINETESFPTELDRPNNPQKPDISLSFLTRDSFIKGYEYLKKLKPENNSIPKLIFRTSPYNVYNIPSEVMAIYADEHKRNAGYQIIYFDDYDCELLINDTQDPDIIYTYNQLIPTAFKADFFRYVALYYYGGIYMDFTHHATELYDKIIGGKNELFLRDKNFYYGINNSFIACKKNNAVLKEAIKLCIENVKNNAPNLRIFDVTGPQLLERAYKNVYEINDDYVKFGTLSVNLTIIEANPLMPDKELYIVNENNERVISYRSLNNHYEYVYGNKRWHYSHLFNEGLIYKNERWLEIENLYKTLLLRNPDMEGIYHYYKSGLAVADISEIISNSPEFKSIQNRG
jgi:mannosyltransferase OCH1-like enzyme